MSTAAERFAEGARVRFGAHARTIVHEHERVDAARRRRCDDAAPAPVVQPWLRRALGTAVSELDRKSTRLNSSHIQKSRMPSSA